MPSEGYVGGRLASGDLAASLVWIGDRFTHELTGPGAHVVAQEGAGGVETPVYQEVHQQGEIVFASGLSGDRHWSASIEPIEGGFLFDVACRAKSLAEGLGVVYEGYGFRVESDPKGPEAPTSVSATSNAHVVAPLAEPAGPPVTVRMRYRIVAG